MNLAAKRKEVVTNDLIIRKDLPFTKAGNISAFPNSLEALQTYMQYISFFLVNLYILFYIHR